MTALRVHSLETFGTHDGPGIRVVVFLQGCFFRCLYCHNPDTWQLDAGTEMETDEILNKVLRFKEYMKDGGGITVSGGEPLIQRKNLKEFFQKCHEHGIHTTLDSNGALMDEDVEELLKHTDLVLLDIKHIDEEKHRHLTGASNEGPLRMLAYCAAHNVKLWIRYVLVPGVTDDPADIERWAQHISQYQNTIELIEILPYHTLGVYKYRELGIPYKLEGVSPMNKEGCEKAKEVMEKYLKNVYIR